MTIEHITLRLSGLSTPHGEIALSDLAPLAAALQLLTTRIARDLNGERRPGRSTTAVDRVSQLRLGTLATGSTTLVLSGGEETLDIDSALESTTFDRLWEIFDSLGSGQRPSWVTLPVAESAMGLADSLGPTTSVEVTGSRAGQPRQQVLLAPRSINRSAWSMSSQPERRSGVAVTGLLEMVDLRSRKFRIRDDVGNEISLDDVTNPRAAAWLVGQRVRAEGEAEHGARGQIAKVHQPDIVAAPLPAQWTFADRAEQDAAVVRAAFAAPGPTAGGVSGLTDDQFEEFLVSLHS